MNFNRMLITKVFFHLILHIKGITISNSQTSYNYNCAVSKNSFYERL